MCGDKLVRVAGIGVVGLVLSLFAPPAAKSDVITYGDFSANQVVFETVKESTTVPGKTVLTDGFGPPTVSGNSLFFQPQMYSVFSAGGTPDFSDFHLSMRISPIENWYIDTVTFSEWGDYSLIGLGTAATTAQVAMPGVLAITKVDGQAINPIVLAANGVISSGGSYTLPADAGIGVSWNGSLVFDVAGALVDNGYTTEVATEVIFSLNNPIVALSEAQTIAILGKTLAVVQVGAEEVPEPASLVLLALGAIGFVGCRIRRRLI